MEEGGVLFSYFLSRKRKRLLESYGVWVGLLLILFCCGKGVSLSGLVLGFVNII